MLEESRVLLDLEASSPAALFQQLGELAIRTGVTDDAAAFVEGLHRREATGSTGFMDGFAIPHCKTDTITQPAIFFVRLKEGLEWHLTDGTLVRNVFCLAIPTSSKEQMAVLGRLSRKLVHTEFRSALKKCSSVQAVTDTVNRAIG